MRKIWVLILSVLLIQLAGKYYSRLWIEDHFYWIPFLLRFVVPAILIATYFRFSIKDLGLGFPQMSRKAWLWTGAAALVIPFIVSLIRFSEGYLDYYPQYVSDDTSEWERLSRFGMFTLSTFFSWAFLHRAYLLGGIRTLLQQKNIKENHAISLAILWTASFEVLYHIVKPPEEAFGLILFSPILSWMAMKTKSIWVPTLLHLYLEACFILTLIFLV